MTICSIQTRFIEIPYFVSKPIFHFSSTTWGCNVSKEDGQERRVILILEKINTHNTSENNQQLAHINRGTSHTSCFYDTRQGSSWLSAFHFPLLFSVSNTTRHDCTPKSQKKKKNKKEIGMDKQYTKWTDSTPWWEGFAGSPKEGKKNVCSNWQTPFWTLYCSIILVQHNYFKVTVWRVTMLCCCLEVKYFFYKKK